MFVDLVLFALARLQSEVWLGVHVTCTDPSEKKTPEPAVDRSHSGLF